MRQGFIKIGAIIGTILNMVACFITIVGGYLILDSQAGDTVGHIFVYFFGIYFIVFIIFLGWREYVYSRKARYAEATNSYHMCNHYIRDACYLITKDNHAQMQGPVLEAIRSTLNQLAKGFSIITGVNCRVCIKWLTYDGEPDSLEKERNFYLQTFIRSSEETIEPPSPRDDKDWLINNTDFEQLFRSNDKVFFCNNLEKLTAYKNSHWPDNPDERKGYLKDKRFNYIATVIWPIRKILLEHHNDSLLLGFLCVDAKTRGVFELRYDYDLGAMVSDALFTVLQMYEEKYHPFSEKGEKQ